MRDIIATILPNSLVTVEGDAGFVEEHNAARLIIELNEELTAEDISHYCFCFDIYGLGRKIVSNNIYGVESDAPATKSGNTLICPLPEVLTSTGELVVQIEAHKTVNGEANRIVKSGIFTLQFEPSVTGCDENLEEACGLLPRLQAVLAGIELLKSDVVLCSPAGYSGLTAKKPTMFYLVDDEAEEEEDDTEEDIPVTGLSLNKTTSAFFTGCTETLTATILPDNATNKAFTWASSNTAIATVSQAGLVTGISPGTAGISATSADGDLTCICTFTISTAVQIIAVTGVTLNKSTASILSEATETLTATVTPNNADNKAVSWSTSNTAVATVAAGVVTGVGAGTATITVTTANGGFTASCTITVAVIKGLWQGSKTVNGITTAISGNHIVMNGTKTTANYASGSSYFTDNITNVANAAVCLNWCTFKAGDVIAMTVKNKTGSCSESGANLANASCQLRNAANAVLFGTTWGTSTGTFNYTFAADTAVIGLFCYLNVGAVLTNYAFDVEFSVNGARWF